jgi:hypothetical protein
MKSAIAQELPILSVELRARHGARTVDFYASGPTSLSVGSGPSCDVWLSGASIPLVCFYLERSGSSLVLIPTESGRGLTVNAKPALEAVDLPPRAILEFGAERVFATTFESTAAPSELASLDTDDLPTRAILISTSTEPIPTQVIWRQVNTEPIARIYAPTNVPAIQQFSAMSAVLPCVHETTPSLAEEVITLSAPIDTPVSPPLRGLPVLGVVASGKRAESKQGRTPTSMPASRVASPAPRESPVADAAPLAGAPIAHQPSHRKLVSLVVRAVTRLGVRTKAQPRKVAGVALLSAIAVALILAGLSRWVTRTAIASTPLASSAATAPTAPSRAELLQPPPVRVFTGGTEGTGAARERATEALRHLFSGREADARVAYARLAAELPEARAYATVARLLERRAAAPCNTEQARDTNCPELKR